MGFYTYGVDTSVLPHKGDCIRPTRDRNPLYPLPPQFDKLSPKEKSWWRVNACCIQETPADFVEAYAFFFGTYIWPREAGFLEDRRMPPPFHYLMVHDIAAHHFNAFGAPRHACKTTLLRVVFLLLLLTRRSYRLGYLTSKQKKYREGINAIRKQLMNNRLIHRDFGILQARRGRGESWNSDEIELVPPFNNKLTGMSLEGKERGWHGEFLGIDDAEKDPDTDEVVPEYVRKLDTKLRFVFIPMVEIAPEDLHKAEINSVGRGITMMGTIIGEDMVLNRILTAEPGGPYDAWNRWKFEQETMGHFLWPERWGKRSSEIQRRVLGDDAFDSEKQNRPGKSQQGVWEIHPLFHTYHAEKPEEFIDNPWESKGLVRWAVQGPGGVPTWKSLSCHEFVSSMNIGIIVDTHKITDKVSATSDFTVAHVIGNDSNSCLWSLDLRRGRFTTDEAINNIFDLCFKWRPSFVAIESCGLYGRIADELMLNLQDKLQREIGWVPFPMELGPFNKVTESKGQRIERISWRFRVYRIRFPWWRRQTAPYDQCWHEVQNFTRDLTKLKYDDIVDTLGSTPYVFRGPGGRPVKTNPWDGRSVVQLIESGKLITKGGAHLADMLPSFGDLTDRAAQILESFYEGQTKKKVKRIQSRPLRTLHI